MKRGGRGHGLGGCGLGRDFNPNVETETFGLGSLGVIPVAAGH